MKYSIITCVNDLELYKKTGIDDLNVEAISIDNINNQYNLPEAYNLGLSLSHGEVLIFCHQDVVFPSNWIDLLEREMRAVTLKDENWGVLGIMGVTRSGGFAGHIVDPHTNSKLGRLPCEVQSLDEVCLIMNKRTGLRFDERLGGYHFYGADLCLQANHKGMKCYAIDAPLTHLSAGNVDTHFHEMAEKLKRKWHQIAKSPLAVETTCGVFPLKEGLSPKLVVIRKKILRKVIRRLQGRYKIANG